MRKAVGGGEGSKKQEETSRADPNGNVSVRCRGWAETRVLISISSKA